MEAGMLNILYHGQVSEMPCCVLHSCETLRTGIMHHDGIWQARQATNVSALRKQVAIDEEHSLLLAGFPSLPSQYPTSATESRLQRHGWGIRNGRKKCLRQTHAKGKRKGKWGWTFACLAGARRGGLCTRTLHARWWRRWSKTEGE